MNLNNNFNQFLNPDINHGNFPKCINLKQAQQKFCRVKNMSSENLSKSKRNKYRKIDEDKRMEIIERTNNGESLKTVAD